MTRKTTWARLAVAVVLSLPLIGCKDTKTLQENEHLKAQVAELQKENGQLGNELETMTAARDALTKENEALKAEMKARKTKHGGTKAVSRKHNRRKRSRPFTSRRSQRANRFLIFVVRKRRVRSMKTFEVHFRYRHRDEKTAESTVKVDASSLPGGVAKAPREFVKSLDRKQRFDMNKN